MSVHLSIFDMLVDMVSEPQIAPRVIQHKYTGIYYNVHIIYTFDTNRKCMADVKFLRFPGRFMFFGKKSIIKKYNASSSGFNFGI